MNNNNMQKYLPIGTIVLLKNATKRLMVTGFCAVDAESADKKMYDYSGCMYPEGVVSSNQTALFNHEDIDKIYYMGLVDKEEKEFKAKLEDFVANNDVSSLVQQNSTPVQPAVPNSTEN